MSIPLLLSKQSIIFSLIQNTSVLETPAAITDHHLCRRNGISSGCSSSIRLVFASSQSRVGSERNTAHFFCFRKSRCFALRPELSREDDKKQQASTCTYEVFLLYDSQPDTLLPASSLSTLLPDQRLGSFKV